VPRVSVREAGRVGINTAHSGAPTVENYKAAFDGGSGIYDLTVHSSY
jgi:hypothetical protein